MKHTKRLAALTLVLALLLGLMPMAALAAGNFAAVGSATEDMTRGELAENVRRVFNGSVTNLPTTQYYDVAPDHPYYEAIRYCVSKDILTLPPTEEFKPDGPIDRASLANLLVHIGCQTEDVSDVECNDSVGNWADEYIRQVLALGVMSVDSYSNFGPNSNALVSDVDWDLVKEYSNPDDRSDHVSITNGLVETPASLIGNGYIFVADSNSAVEGSLVNVSRIHVVDNEGALVDVRVSGNTADAIAAETPHTYSDWTDTEYVGRFLVVTGVDQYGAVYLSRVAGNGYGDMASLTDMGNGVITTSEAHTYTYDDSTQFVYVDLQIDDNVPELADQNFYFSDSGTFDPETFFDSAKVYDTPQIGKIRSSAAQKPYDSVQVLVHSSGDLADHVYVLRTVWHEDTSNSHEQIASGTCGAEGNVTWTLTTDGTLTIRGTGELTQFYLDGGMYYVSTDMVTTVVVEEGITAIGEVSFAGYPNLTDVILPDSVTKIGDDAFLSCYKLSSITLPNNLTDIGDFAFAACGKLTNVEIPSSVRHIGTCAFVACDGLTDVTIPASVTSVGGGAFAECYGLSEFAVEDGNPIYTTVDGVLVDQVENVLVAFPAGRKLTQYTIPDGITSIGDRAFDSCSGLTSVTIPTSVTSIGDNAFYSCDGLTSITIPNSVTSIASGAFTGCAGLTEFKVAAGNPTYAAVDGVLVNRVEDVLVAFPAGKELTQYTIPDGIASIGQNAFQYCDELTAVIIPADVTSIGNRAFTGCPNLTICGYLGSVADTYAEQNYIPFGIILPQATVHVPYSADLTEGVVDDLDKGEPAEASVTTKDKLPDGLTLSADGVLSGRATAQAEGEYLLTVPMVFTYQDGSMWVASGQRYYIRVVGATAAEEETETTWDETVWNTTDENYELTVAIPNKNGTTTNIYDEEVKAASAVNRWTNADMSLRSLGEFSYFEALYLNGRELKGVRWVPEEPDAEIPEVSEWPDDVDYYVQEGSTVMVIRTQTLNNEGPGTHTISAQFKQVASDGTESIKRASQNYTIPKPTPSYSGGGGGGASAAKPAEKPAEEVKLPQMKFLDVPQGAWFYADVEWAFQNGYMIGTGDDFFSPAAEISCPMVTTVLARLGKVDLAQFSDVTGTGVEPGQWHTNASVWAWKSGIVGDGTYSPQPPLSRGDMAVMLVRYLNYLAVEYDPVKETVVFADREEMSAEEDAAFQLLYANGILKGVGDNAMAPNGSASRAELAAVLHRLADYLARQ